MYKYFIFSFVCIFFYKNGGKSSNQKLLDHCEFNWIVLPLFLQSFWHWLNKLLKTVFEKSNDQRRPSVPLIQPRDPLGFTWWIITHVASFYRFDRHGAPDEMVSCFFFNFLMVSTNTFFFVDKLGSRNNKNQIIILQT